MSKKVETQATKRKAKTFVPGKDDSLTPNLDFAKDLKQLRAEMEQKGMDIMNINDFVRIEMDVEGPLFNEQGECIFCKAHDIVEKDRNHDCEFFKCGCPACVIAEYFYEEEKYLKHPEPPRPLEEFQDDPRVMAAAKNVASTSR